MITGVASPRGSTITYSLGTPSRRHFAWQEASTPGTAFSERIDYIVVRCSYRKETFCEKVSCMLTQLLILGPIRRAPRLLTLNFWSIILYKRNVAWGKSPSVQVHSGVIYPGSLIR